MTDRKKSVIVSEAGPNRKKATILAVSFSLLVAMVLLGLILLLYKWKKNKQKLKEEFELPLFELSTITRATNNFSVSNKIGEGGFGPVYKVYIKICWNSKQSFLVLVFQT